MNQAHGLSSRTLQSLRDALSRFPEVEKATLFGSRAKGTHKTGSDIDLALSGADLDWRVLGRIYTELDNSTSPYQFSLVHLDERTDPEVAGHIRRVGIPIYERVAAEAR